MIKNIFSETFPFIGWVEFEKSHTEPYGDYGVYLINPTSDTYEKVELFTGMFEGTGGLLESSKVVMDIGTLKPQSSIMIGAISWYDLDFVIWYHLDFFSILNAKPLCYWFDIMKAYAWDEKKIQPLTILNTNGIRIDLKLREDGVPISEEIKHTYMESRYTPEKE